MRKILAIVALLFLGAPAYGQDVHMFWQSGSGFTAWTPVSSANPVPVTGTFTPSGTSPEFTPVAPATATATKGVLNGCQYDSTQKTLADGQQSATSCSNRGAFIVATGADSFTIANTTFTATQATAASLNATVVGTGTFAVQAAQSGTWTVQPGNTPNTTAWLTTNTLSSAAGAATTSASSTAAASNLVLKGSAGNLYSLTITIGATSGYAMLFDATSLPSNGAVTPVWCYPITSNGTNGGVAIEFANPKRFGTGITAGFSTTGCFTLTASATGNFFGGYQ